METIETNDKAAKTKMKEYADKRRNTKESDIEVGDTVLVKSQHRGKLKPFYETTPYKVIERNGAQVIAENATKQVTRNVSHFKKVDIQMDDKDTYNDKDAYTYNDKDAYIQIEIESEEDEQEIAIPQQRPRRYRRRPSYLNDYIA